MSPDELEDVKYFLKVMTKSYLMVEVGRPKAKLTRFFIHPCLHWCKGRQLEVGARRAPKLLVSKISGKGMAKNFLMVLDEMDE